MKSNVKIGVLCLKGLETFLPDIVNRLEDTYNVRSYYGNDQRTIEEIINWSDIIWLEWANELTIHVTQNCDLTNKKVIVRLHSYEALSGYCTQINWAKVNTLIFVAKHVREVIEKQNIKIPGTVKKVIVHNGIDTKKFRRGN